MKRIAVWVPVAAVAIWALVRLTGQEHTWYGVTLIAFTPWVTLAAVAPVVAALLTREWWAAGVAGAALLTLALLVVPRGFGGPDPGAGPRLVVMSTNMEFGQADPATIVALVRDHHVDVAAFQEFAPSGRDALLAAGLETLLPYHAWAVPGYSASGSAIWSRFPLTGTWTQTMAGTFHQEHAVVHVPGATPFEVVSVHTRAPSGPDDLRNWAVSMTQEPKPDPAMPRLLIGDFNSTLDHVALRRIVDSGYRDIADVLGDALETTWPYDGRDVPVVTLDHILADPRIGAVDFATFRVPRTDHKTLIATVTLP